MKVQKSLRATARVSPSDIDTKRMGEVMKLLKISTFNLIRNFFSVLEGELCRFSTGEAAIVSLLGFLPQCLHPSKVY